MEKKDAVYIHVISLFFYLWITLNDGNKYASKKKKNKEFIQQFLEVQTFFPSSSLFSIFAGVQSIKHILARGKKSPFFSIIIP